MIKTIAIVSLSSGILGERFVRHEYDLGMKRLKAYGLTIKVMPNAMKGITYLREHPEKRAEDLIKAFSDPDIDMILCAIGGDDTYSLLPYLMEEDRLKNALHPKIFLGFSDTTHNHLLLHKLGLRTFYGQAFLPDICELDREMLAYSGRYFEELITTGTIAKLTPSDVWYEEREDFSEKALGTPRRAHPNDGFRLLQGDAVFEGEILGGCLESLYDLFVPTRHKDSASLSQRYGVFPEKKEWEGKILLLETSEEKISPAMFETMLRRLKETGIFSVIRGILFGKPMDDCYAKEYEQILTHVVDTLDLSIVTNLPVGHATPRAIVPLGVVCRVDVELQRITFGSKQ